MAEVPRYQGEADTSADKMPDYSYNNGHIEPEKQRYPYCVVWTPIPLLTWLIPIVGHMGIGMSSGVIRDFAGPYFVSEDNMAFGTPTKYWQLSLDNIPSGNGREIWDRSVYEASEVYKGRMHNLCCDNCHSHVALALNKMRYSNETNWNMFKLVALLIYHGKYVSCRAWLKTWLPFLMTVAIIASIFIGIYS